nr:MAG TPA: hypothetical protein [Caudoviricetes sp.]
MGQTESFLACYSKAKNLSKLVQRGHCHINGTR